MLSTVKTKPNHYELLGLSPTASAGEIAQAFAREVGMFRARSFGGTAEICLAYAVLNDPAKRRAYDASIGLTAEPKPKTPALTSITIGYRQEWTAAPFVAARQPVAAADEAKPEARSPPVAPDEANPEAPSPPVSRAPAPHRGTTAPMTIKEQVERVVAQRGSAEGATPESVEWAKPGLIVAGLLLAAAAIGVFAGLSSVETVESETAVAAVPVGGSPAKPKPASALEARRAPAVPIPAGPEPEVGTTKRPASSRRAIPAESLPAVPAGSITESIQVVRVPAADTAPEDGATEQATVAALPISDKAIARIIERIGYACGAVDSTAPIDGAGAGVFKVSCTSGDAYRAAPIRGRYHFRRLD